eukprot:CAMPEP_0198565212 /NCGR_PEP_ID=MMETSP1462-20131121/101459_1 /TAXON_ID=1333877 /ORGANISM="Brandtodinium nutriculum, Strain RCC3387" /LENGTH=196 /DNA_ID=CAMNT_0044296201 /DNA_START=19 /DNA_END=606 /DNA_ORIENTATION=+
MTMTAYIRSLLDRLREKGSTLPEVIVKLVSPRVVASLLFEQDLGVVVFQEVAEALRPEHCHEVAKALSESATEVALRPSGSTMLRRVMELAGQDSSVSLVMDKVTARSWELVRRPESREVLAAVLAHGSSEQRQKLLAALCRDLPKRAGLWDTPTEVLIRDALKGAYGEAVAEGIVGCQKVAAVVAQRPSIWAELS